MLHQAHKRGGRALAKVQKEIFQYIHGKGGFTLINRLIWMLSRPVVCKLDELMSEHAGVEIKEGQSGVKLNRKTRIEHDNKDLHTLEMFLSKRFINESFYVNTELKNIATGLVSPSNVIIQDSFIVGAKIIKSLVGRNPLTLTIKEKDLAVQMPFKCISGDNCSSGNFVYPQMFLSMLLPYHMTIMVRTKLV